MNLEHKNLYEPNKEEVLEYLNRVKRMLEFFFDINELTTAELLHIRKDIESIMGQNHEIKTPENKMSPHTEAFWRFIASYGIDRTSLPIYVGTNVNGQAEFGPALNPKMKEYIADKLRQARFEDNKL